jgi:hypothetical protein
VEVAACMAAPLPSRAVGVAVIAAFDMARD